MHRTLTVSEAARELGRSERWLRQAERKGKIPQAKRDLNGWRVYTKEDIARLSELLVPTLEPEDLMGQKPSSDLGRDNVEQ